MSPISNVEKARVWQCYYERKPIRVPLRWNVNSRVLLLNPALNPEGIGYRQYFHDPLTMLQVQARFAEYVATVINRVCDAASGCPRSGIFRWSARTSTMPPISARRCATSPGRCPARTSSSRWRILTTFSPVISRARSTTRGCASG